MKKLKKQRFKSRYLNFHIYNLLKEYCKLNGEDTPVPSNHVVNRIYTIVRILNRHKIFIYHLFLGFNGEIVINIRNDKKSLEIIIYNDRETVVLYEKGKIPTKEKFIPNNLFNYINWLVKN